MAMKYESINCPKCGTSHQIDERQKQIWCGSQRCAFYLNRNGEIENYEPGGSSTTPLYESAGLALDAFKSIKKNKVNPPVSETDT